MTRRVVIYQHCDHILFIFYLGNQDGNDCDGHLLQGGIVMATEPGHYQLDGQIPEASKHMLMPRKCHENKPSLLSQLNYLVSIVKIIFYVFLDFVVVTLRTAGSDVM